MYQFALFGLCAVEHEGFDALEDGALEGLDIAHPIECAIELFDALELIDEACSSPGSHKSRL